mmetsp:Transcript_27195/g.41121  ORF Transcript_27195/g.41121 Transcript_27195/m.41121 type:complete len:201 (-) Transcript_27195:264-866(-)
MRHPPTRPLPLPDNIAREEGFCAFAARASSNSAAGACMHIAQEQSSASAAVAVVPAKAQATSGSLLRWRLGLLFFLGWGLGCSCRCGRSLLLHRQKRGRPLAHSLLLLQTFCNSAGYRRTCGLCRCRGRGGCCCVPGESAVVVLLLQSVVEGLPLVAFLGLPESLEFGHLSVAQRLFRHLLLLLSLLEEETQGFLDRLVS